MLANSQKTTDAQIREESLAKRRAAYAALPPEEKSRRAAIGKARRAARLAAETPTQRERRLEAGRARSRANRQRETPEQRQKRLEYLRQYKKPYAEKNKDRIKELAKDYYAKNSGRLIQYGKAYRAKHRARIHKRRYAIARATPERLVAARLRHRVYLAVRCSSARKCAKTMEIVGCSKQFLVDWIGFQFTNGMSWANAGKWHIDHIIPCAAFNLHDESQQRVAFHYTNLRPLWGAENAAKRDRLPVEPRERWTTDCVFEARRALGLPQPSDMRQVRAAV